MASESAPVKPAAPPKETNPLVYVAGVFAVLALGVFGYLQYLSRHPSGDLPLTPEARAYVRNLKLSDVAMKAADSYLGQTVVELSGNIGNGGTRQISTIEIYCVFHDTYGQLVLRQRVPIVSARMGGLKPGETKTFRLPFEDLPQSWNQAMPQLVIAGVKFAE